MKIPAYPSNWLPPEIPFHFHLCKDRYLYPANLSITIDGGNKIFCDKTRFAQYISTNPALQKVLEGKQQPKEAHFTHTQKKNQATDNLTSAKNKEGKHTTTHNETTTGH